MKQEERLEKLFKVAKEEEVHFSYERIAEQFKQQTSIASTLQHLLSKIIHMNTLLVMLTGGLLGTWWYFSSTPSTNTLEVTESHIEGIHSAVLETAPLSIDIEEESKENPVSSQSTKTSVNTNLRTASFLEKSSIPSTLIDSVNISLDTPIRISLPTPELAKEFTSFNVNSESESVPQPLRQPNIFYQLIEINQEDDAQQILKTKQAIGDMGFEVKKLHTNRKKGAIEKVALHLIHPQGLDWKFMVTEFQKIELKVIKDDKVGLRAFAYRFNGNGSFSPLISLTEKSISKHRVASGTKGRHINRKKKQD